MRLSQVIVDKDCVEFPVAKRLKQLALDRSGVLYHEIEPGGARLEELTRGLRSLLDIKSTLVVTKREGFYIDEGGEGTGNPACDFDLQFVWGCPHRCAFCQQIYFIDRRPFIEIYPDLDKMLEEVRSVVDASEKSLVLIEAGGMTDLLALESCTGILKDMIRFWATELAGRSQLQFLTKSADVQEIMGLDPRNAVRIGFSVNLPEFAAKYAIGTAPLKRHKEAIKTVLKSGYHLHLSFSPILYRRAITERYDALLNDIRAFLDTCDGFSEHDLTLDALIFFQKERGEQQVRKYYPDLAQQLLQHCQHGSLHSDDRYCYPQEIHDELASFFRESFERYFPSSHVWFVA